MVHGLRGINNTQLEHLPRMAGFAPWAAACETALWPAGTFARAFAANRRAAIESIIEADPLATCVRGDGQSDGYRFNGRGGSLQLETSSVSSAT